MIKPTHTTILESELEQKTGNRLRARKSLGQHFLVDKKVLKEIISTADLSPEDTVVEVGPGQGMLTRELVRKARIVIAIEIDSRLAGSLAERLGNPPGLRVINEDAREVDLACILEGVDKYKVVANLPYYAANPILRHFIESPTRRPSMMVVMVQEEVATRMVAQKGRMSLLAVGVQLFGAPSIICRVPPSAFKPPPKVYSAVVRVDTFSHPAVELDDEDEFFGLVRAGFFAPRKQLRNSLMLGRGISAYDVTSLLELAGLDPKLRPENLSIDDWGKLYRAGKGRWTFGNPSLRKN